MEISFHDTIQTVSELTDSIRGLLETSFSFVTVVGEISNLRRPASGHLYFTLKDQNSQIKAVLFKMQQRYLTHPPEDGLEVICRGRVSVYEPRGEYQIIVDSLDHKGEGVLRIALDRLRNKLAAEGLFDEAHKKNLPAFPKRVALITSPKGAAVVDFLRMARERFPAIPIEIFPVRVQGDVAADEIVEALGVLNQRRGSDVLVLCRGGGSLEDLWAFNEEKVARAIYHSAIPVVSAVGHEIDYTVADLAADLRAPTPTAAAEMVLPSRAELGRKLIETQRRMTSAMLWRIHDYTTQLASFRRLLGDPSLLLAHFMLRLDHARTGLNHALAEQYNAKQQRLDRIRDRLMRQNPAHRLARQRQRTQELTRRLHSLIDQEMERKTNKLGLAASLLDAVSPLAVLGRGYAIARTKKARHIIHSANQVDKGDSLNLVLHEGELDCQVTQIHLPRDTDTD